MQSPSHLKARAPRKYRKPTAHVQPTREEYFAKLREMEAEQRMAQELEEDENA